MATGAADANGIWIYGEDDNESTHSALLNKLGNSVSTTVTRLEEMSGLTAAQLTTHRDNIGVGLVNVVPTSVAQAGGSASANAQGLVTFAGVTSFSLNSVFTSAYSNYRIVVNAKASAATNLNFRFRTSGTDISAGYYGASIYATNNTGVAVGDQKTNADTSFFGGLNTTNGVSVTSEIQPEAGVSKIFNNISLSYIGGVQICSYSTTTGTRPDGFTIYPVSGSVTGTVQVFGYNN